MKNGSSDYTGRHLFLKGRVNLSGSAFIDAALKGTLTNWLNNGMVFREYLFMRLFCLLLWYIFCKCIYLEQCFFTLHRADHARQQLLTKKYPGIYRAVLYMPGYFLWIRLSLFLQNPKWYAPFQADKWNNKKPVTWELMHYRTIVAIANQKTLLQKQSDGRTLGNHKKRKVLREKFTNRIEIISRTENYIKYYSNKQLQKNPEVFSPVENIKSIWWQRKTVTSFVSGGKKIIFF